MVQYKPHTLVEFGGTLQQYSGSDEIWTCGIRCGDVNESYGPAANPGQYLDPMAAALATWYAKPASGMSGASHLTFLKINNIGANGKYTTNPTNVHEYSGSGIVGGGSSSWPTIISVAYTWETGFKRGRAARGRIYPPNPTYGGLGSVLTLPQATLARDAAIDLIQSVFAAMRSQPFEDYLVPGVYSSIDASYRPVTGVSVDCVVDVQRRRKNRVQAPRTTVAPINYNP